MKPPPQTVAEFDALAREIGARFKRPKHVQRAEAVRYIRQTIQNCPQYKFMLPFVDDGNDNVILYEILLAGALDGRLDFHEMLNNLHPNPTVRREAKRKVKKMSQGKLPFMREQLD
jgi:hypothetical protein